MAIRIGSGLRVNGTCSIGDVANPCVYCRLITRPAAERPFFDTVLAETDSLVVIPALGALEVGHVLIVTKEHVTSFAQASSVAQREAGELAQSLRLDRRSMVFEHGSHDGCAGAACIDHAHLSVVPTRTILDPGLPQVGLGATLEEAVNTMTQPYLLLSAPDRSFVVYSDHGQPSQYFRRLYCGASGRDDWDWAAFPAHDKITRTLELWR